MARVYTGSNPSQLYLNALRDLRDFGEEANPRGKATLEIRPVMFEYTQPTNQVTLLEGRLINPFFQRAEALWIMRGRSDVKWLTQYNKNMEQFSDDGVHFNAPYGERLRYWGQSNALDIHPEKGTIDQLWDAYKKLSADPDSRQAYVSIYNPLFDHIGILTKDRPCNLGITFKIRKGKLDITVMNRSNDVHWGTFGANLCQFATIQEAMASWLGVQVGTYVQMTDSMHIYTDSYGAGETDKVLKHYPGYKPANEFDAELRAAGASDARINSSWADWHEQANLYWHRMDRYVSDPSTYDTDSHPYALSELLKWVGKDIRDPYFQTSVHAMMTYQAYKLERYEEMCHILTHIPEGKWKISMLRFLSKKVLKSDDHAERFASQYLHMDSDIVDYIERVGE